MNLFDLLRNKTLKFKDNGTEISCESWVITKSEDGRFEFDLLIDGIWQELYSEGEDDVVVAEIIDLQCK
jgi:hypothetical protein